ncbi:hypothetical protein XELAEV_18029154mg [Xenopus laevis]|uniref:Uncharacterized protein n=1 Tax=Xenopus laevis TaxID=8355 RepID=A0A974CSK2_XENLA|nr:hypothetical protein XELAEV_18029154mg [Xenopus laevis]
MIVCLSVSRSNLSNYLIYRGGRGQQASERTYLRALLGLQPQSVCFLPTKYSKPSLRQLRHAGDYPFRTRTKLLAQTEPEIWLRTSNASEATVSSNCRPRLRPDRKHGQPQKHLGAQRKPWKAHRSADTVW